MIWAMPIEIGVEESHPPSGVVVVDGGDRHLFSGWLGLLHLLARALDPDVPARPPEAPHDQTASALRTR
jgi:hypothetical protein